MRAQRLELGAEEQHVPEPAVVHRLLAQAVACERECAFDAVPHRECEHAVALLDGALDAPGRDGLHQHLGVGVTTEDVSGARKDRADLVGVVDLTVVGEDEAFRSGDHRLRASLGEVHDRQPAMPQRYASFWIDPGTVRVRAPIADRVRHPLSERGHVAAA